MAGLSFLPLLAQSLGVKLSGMEEGTPPQYQNGIEVSGATPQQQPMESLLPQQAPARQDTPVDLSGVRGRQLSQEEYRRSLPYENLPEHKGMFGLQSSEARRVGNECVRTCRSRWSAKPSKKQTGRLNTTNHRA